MAWTSKMSTALTAISVRPRRPAAVSAVWTAPVARIDGIGRRSIDHARSVTRRIVAPPPRAGDRVAGQPVERGGQAGRAVGRSPRRVEDADRGTAAANPAPAARPGRPRSVAAGGPFAVPRGIPPSRAGRRPSSTRRSITTRSRSGSIAGLVTWAKACRRWSATGRSSRARPGVGVSSPMLHSGSWPSSAIVLMSSRARSASRPARCRSACEVCSAMGRDRRVEAILVDRARRVVDRQAAQDVVLGVGVLEDRVTARFDEEELARPEPTAANCLGRS